MVTGREGDTIAGMSVAASKRRRPDAPRREGEHPAMEEKESRFGVLPGAGVSVILLLSLCGVWLASIFYLLEAARKASATRIASNSIRLHELEARRAEKDFLLRSLRNEDFFRDGRSEYLERHSREVRLLLEETEGLSDRMSFAERSTLDSLLEKVRAYERNFTKLVEAYRERGFREWGREGQLARALHDLATAIESTRDPAVHRETLSLAERQAEYLVDPGPSTASELASSLESLRRRVAESSQSPNSAVERIEAYRAELSALLSVEERIGFTEEDGLQGELRAAIHSVEPAVDEILERSERADERANGTLVIGLFITSGIMAGLLLLTFGFAQVARLRNSRLLLLNQQMDEEHRRLLQSERLAAIGQMVTGLAHESRNALQRTHACLDMLRTEVEDRSEAVRLVDRIEEAQDDLHRLYEQLREYAAPLRMRARPASVSQILRMAWQRLELVRSGRDVEIEEEGPDVDTVCEIDTFALEQVFRNVFENSLAACKDPVRIHVSYREVDSKADPALVVSIRDNGPGLDPEQRSRIFEPFFTTKTKGTGLGMAIAKRLVDAHGGTIALGTELGSGAELVITIPRNSTRT